jgi:hypothetical protein
MKDLSYDIEQLYIEGFSPVGIAAQLGCPLGMIYDWLEAQNVEEGDDNAQLV